MKLLVIRDVSKEFAKKKGDSFKALKNVNLSFDHTGLVSVVGKSGSGKSTLLSLIARFDEPSSGEIILDGHNYSRYKKRHSHHFYTKEIGIVHQNYQLLEDKTVLMNVLVPLYLAGKRKVEALKIAKETLSMVGIGEDLLNKEASYLSGGEKQRVGIARAIVNNPRILLCDEPTGSLDSKNSIIIMELLKKISEDRLVILVSHNLQLVNKYSDRIIDIIDGEIRNDRVIKRGLDNRSTSQKDRPTNKSWIDIFASQNYRKRFKRNIVSSIAFSISVSMLYLVIGFINGKDNSIKEACSKQFDFGSGTISLDEKTNSEGLLSISKSTRPELNELEFKTDISKKYEICLNFSAILPQNIEISYQDQKLDDLIFTPVYSFSRPYVDTKLITKGSVPNSDNRQDIIINDSAYRLLKSKLNKDPMYEKLNIYNSIETNYVDVDGTSISDVFVINQSIRISGVVKELNYLQSPKIYYSYSAYEEYLKEVVLLNLSTYYDKTITWYDRIYDAENYSLLSSYSYYLFLKDINYSSEVYEPTIIPTKYTFTSQSLLIADSLFKFLEVAQYGIIFFTAITFIGSILILAIMSFASYSEDHKTSAILSSLGATDDDIQDIYVSESVLNGFLSYAISTGLAIGLSYLINYVINRFIDLKNVVVIPFSIFINIKFLLPIMVLVFILIISTLSTLIPIVFSKRRSLKGELQSL